MDDKNPQSPSPSGGELPLSGNQGVPQSPLSGITIDLPSVVPSEPQVLAGETILPQSSSGAPSNFAPSAPVDTYVVPASPASSNRGEPSQGGQAAGAQGSSSQSVTTTADNQFIPQGVATMSVPPAASGGSSMPRRLIMIIVFILLAFGAMFGGKFILGLFSGVKEVTISYWGLWENDAVIRPVISAFEEANPKIKVEYVKQSPKQYRERLQSAITRGDGPDVFRFHNTWVAMLKNELALVPKTVMTTADFSSTFYPIASASLVAGSSIFGIPIEIEGLGLYYNEDLFAAAGAKVPVTWEDILNVVPKLAVRSGNTITTAAIALGTWGNVENASDILATMMLQNGANLVSPTGKEAEETLIFYKKFATPSDPVYTWNDTLDNSIYAFAIGKVAMIIAPSWRAFDIKQINPSLRFKIAPTPQLPGSAVNWASFWVEGVSAKSKYPDQAWAFLKYLTSKEAVIKLYTEASKLRLFGEPYARIELASTIAEDPYAGAFVKQAQNAKTFPLASRTFDNGLNDKLIKYMEDAVNGFTAGSAPTAVLETMAAGFRQVLSQFGLVSSTPAVIQ